MSEPQDRAVADRPAQSAPLAPGLYLIGTPIGNLEDITLRALRVLASVDRIACEDTRQTSKLLHHFGISKPMVSYHLHNEQGRAEELVSALAAGARIALVSDAGLPGIADPGEALIRACIEAGVAVFPVPGANAALSALSASGLPTEQFIFHGFLPAKQGQRRTRLEELRAEMGQTGNAGTHIFYEAPHRILECLAEIAQVFGPDHRIVLGRELTKLHEEFLRGTVDQVRQKLESRESVRGEMVLLLEGRLAQKGRSGSVTAPSLADEVRSAMRGGMSEKEALKQVARTRGLGKSDAYREWQRSGKGSAGKGSGLRGDV